jgi:hypothetical protein
MNHVPKANISKDFAFTDVVQRINTPSTQTDTLQRQETEEELQLKEAFVNEIVQRQEATDESEVSTDLESAINSAKGSGQPLDKNLQQSMGQAIGADFSKVRVHTDSQADKLNRSIQAKAFTTGQDVFFRQAEYQPGNREGQELIAHELTHVVQQKGSAVQQKPIQKNGELEARLNCKNEIAWQSTKKTSYLMTGNNRLQAMTYVTGIKSFQNQAKNYKNRTWDINHFHGWLVKIKEANQDKFPELVYEQLEPKDMAKLVKEFSTYVDENGIDGLEIEKPKEKYLPPVIGLFEDLTLLVVDDSETTHFGSASAPKKGVASLRDDLKRDSSIVKIIKQQSNGESEHFFAFGIT